MSMLEESSEVSDARSRYRERRTELHILGCYKVCDIFLVEAK
jgi:hypothetical protein